MLDCMFLSWHIRVSEWIQTLQLPECQRTPCSKQAWNLKFKWLQLDSNPEPISSLTNTQPFGQTGHERANWSRTNELHLRTKWFWVRVVAAVTENVRWFKARVTIKPTEGRQYYSGTALVPISGSIRHGILLALLVNLNICFMSCD